MHKKKSKSIDNSQKYQSVSISKNKTKLKISKNISMNGLTNSHKIEPLKKPLYKKSLDLTES